MLSDKTQVVSLLSGFAHFLLAISVFLGWGTLAQSPSFAYFPDHIWPAAFLVQSLFAFWGYTDVTKLRLSFYIGSCIMVGWTVATIFSSILAQQFQPTIPWLLYIAAMKWLIAEYAFKLQKVQDTAQRITEEVLTDGATPTREQR